MLEDKALFDRDALVNWLRKQAADEEYIFQDPVFCLMGKYLADNGSAWGYRAYSEMPDYEKIAGEKPWTFGAALERAQALPLLPPPVLQITSEVKDDDAASEHVSVSQA